MCVLILHHRTRSDHPLVLLHNRDEYYDREFEGPRLRDARHGILAPLDRREGGTWLGVNRAGLVVGLTNRRAENLEGDVRSRGRITLDALRCPDASAALHWLREHLAHTAYAGFHAFLVDGSEAYAVRHRGDPAPRPLEAADVFPLSPGAHVLTNLHEPGVVPVPSGAEPEASEPIEATLERLQAVAGDDKARLPGGHAILKRGEGRGTVCSALLAPPIFRFAAGPPDRAPFLDVSGLLA